MSNPLIERMRLTFSVTGKRFGHVIAIGPSFTLRLGKKRMRLVVCQCDCGRAAVFYVQKLKQRASWSCGCDEYAALQRHGKKGTRLYRIWQGMKGRCNNRSHKSWQHYGGRGITFCAAWKRFRPFEQWARSAGYNDGLEIDRIDNNGNYEPSNCRWITHQSNCLNKRNGRQLVAFGETKSLEEWGSDRRATVSIQSIARRITMGMSVEDAISSPPTNKGGWNARHLAAQEPA
jgi:hypothetical protein